MTDSNWARLKEYGSRFEADLDVATLQEAGIPVQVKGPVTGIFGPGFAGATAEGVTVLVPAVALHEARALLGLDDHDPLPEAS